MKLLKDMKENFYFYMKFLKWTSFDYIETKCKENHDLIYMYKTQS